jgi:hypothetical protein
MARVVLIPTGRLEWEALGASLERLFPEHIFVAVPTLQELQSNEGMEFPISSFCSNPIEKVAGRPNNADKLIKRAAYEAMKSQRGEKAELVLILDDLELVNHHQAQQVTEEVRAAVLRHLADPRFEQDRDLKRRTQEALRRKVSFHLARPMIESWIFADPQGPTHAGVPATSTISLVPEHDLEDFRTQDAVYAAATAEFCICWSGLPARTAADQKKKNRLTPAWIKAGEVRIQHPKAYMALPES